MENKSIADEILKLNELKEKGIITEEEFNKQKETLLNSEKKLNSGTEKIEDKFVENVPKQPIKKTVWYKTWWGWIFILLFFFILIPYLVWTKTNWKKWVKILITVLCLILFVILAVTNETEESKKERLAKEAVAEKQVEWKKAVDLINQGKLEDAKKTLETFGTLDSKNLIWEINQVSDTNFKMKVLAEMTEDEFKQLKAGTLKKEYIKSAKLNEYFLKNLKEEKDLDKVRENSKAWQKENERIAEQKKQEEKVKGYFSTWDGSNTMLTKYIKNGMNDPKSYKHAETRYKINKDGKTIYVIQSFRGKNAFGGVVLNSCEATQNLETGDLTNISCN